MIGSMFKDSSARLTIKIETAAVASSAQEATSVSVAEKSPGRAFTTALLTTAAAALLIVEPSIAHAANAGAAVTTQESGENMFQDIVIKSLTVDVTIIAILFAFKRQWAKTFSWASGIVYGGYFCAQTIGMMLAVFFTWMNHILQHWLEVVRMG